MSADFDLYLITDAQGTPPSQLLARTALALRSAQPGRIAVQLRLKDRDASEQLDAGMALRALTREHGAQLIVNGPPALARAVGADGVQVPEAGPPIATLRQALGPEALIGASCHDGAGLAAAETAGADFATLSPFHPVPGKGAPLRATQTRAWIAAAGLPVFALGGMDPTTAAPAVAAGAAGVAVIRAVYGAADPADAVRTLLQAIDGARHGNAAGVRSATW